MKRVYVAGPVSKGDMAHNIHQAIDAADKLMAVGYTVFVPHLTFFWHLINGMRFEHEKWMAQDFAWLELCNALIRLPGESKGADMEVDFCKEHSIPVFYSIERFLESQR